MNVRRSSVWIKKVDDEIAKWQGVIHYRTMGGKHGRLVLVYNGQSRFVTFPCTPGCSARALKNHLSWVRQTLRELGAEKTS